MDAAKQVPNPPTPPKPPKQSPRGRVEKWLISVGEQGLVTKHSKIVGILVRVVEGSSDVAAVVKLLTYIASYISQ